MNWGKITVIILMAFVLFIGSLCYIMFKSPDDEYDHQYYENGLTFDRDYVREKLVVDEHAQPIIQLGAHDIRFIFLRKVKGSVKFSRPSSDAPDREFAIDNSEGNALTFPTNDMVKGKWQLVFDWESNNRAYLYQQEVYIK